MLFFVVCDLIAQRNNGPLTTLWQCENGVEKKFFSGCIARWWTDFSGLHTMRYYYAICIFLIVSCRRDAAVGYYSYSDSSGFALSDTIRQAMHPDADLPLKMVTFAETLIGTEYKFGCSAPSTGFDCSGFINYIFDHFNITVPRSSADFTNVGETIPLDAAMPGDLILFTGTDSKIRSVGHIGMVVFNDTAGLRFIHASSGKEMQVTITPLNELYKKRFVKVIRIIK